jgi:predicted transposase/invertase (TIGR01784 family)
MKTKAMEADNISNQHIRLCNRSIYYEHKLFASQENPKLYCDFKQTFQITICDFTVFTDEKFLHKFTFCDGEIQLSDISNIIFLELPKIKKLLNSPVENLTAEEQWAVFIEFFGNKNFYTKLSEFENKEEFKMANNILSNISKNDEERFAYMSYLKFQSDLEHNQNAAREEGEARGLAMGLAKGKAEAAKNFLKMGLSIEQVAKGTGLSVEEISKLSS